MTLFSANTIWCPMMPADLAATVALAATVHTDYPEDNEIFTERLALVPQGCWVLSGSEGVMGYMLSHPWRGSISPPLNTLLGSLPVPADRWYIHDLVLAESARGQGAAQKAIALAEDAARRLGVPLLSLTSTRHAQTFWRKQGFTPEAVSEAERAVLASYDAEASLLSRPVSP
ncbi:GNAT family N-acetyltransferase [Acetobacter senegalensis]|uniref:GNAT family N-acetyltransferase n=1 Tax=Acetobacter senegalensis TaxID=446692 RepID=UPI00128DF08E|nr:GNAT family N-acetyltransferase [Acetobacter senegalensis]MCG4257939.1 GNAT family N-acetyltransferase [Acetobacter senegalensis]MCG4267866.1 GNAT family N-acetyltransferase [Acetobacter senegalensis]MPQ73487.1 GNAT family N-acetyltransferase [Acetobacter senegalensis]